MQWQQLLLGQLPGPLFDELLQSYDSIIKHYRENRWEPAELNGGKFSEVVYCILKGYLENNYPQRAQKPQKFIVACQQLAQIETQTKFGLESVRLTIPRVLIALYEIRNRRSVGHIGGEVDPNHMDATVVVAMTKWVMAELIRILNETNVDTATQAVEALVDRVLPYVWLVEGERRVIVPGMRKTEQILHILYSASKPLSAKELASSTGTRSDNLKAVLKRMHKENKVNFNQKTNIVTLSPLGIDIVEESLIADRNKQF